MTPSEIREEVIETIKLFSIKYKRKPDQFYDIDDDRYLDEQFELDSIDLLDSLLEFCKKYQLTVPPREDFESISTLNKTVDYFYPSLKNIDKK